MHMADALISPAVGATMWTATAVTTAYCAKKVREENDAVRIPLMGVMGAFVFAGQMLNFTIPATGSSGHLGGGLLLAILLGPEAAFLVMASVLTVQALFFADGGLLALGANVFNLGFFPAFVAYPFVYRRLAGESTRSGRLVGASVTAAVVGLLLGAAGVVLETTLSGVSELPFVTFLGLMVPIHLAIGVVEGLVTAAVVVFVSKTQPELLVRTARGERVAGVGIRNVLVGLALVAVLAAGVFTWFASENPDGLEWSIERITGSTEIVSEGSSAHETAAEVQERTALMPDYALPAGDSARDAASVESGTSVAGLLGGAVTLAIAVGIGLVLRRRSNARASSSTDIR